ncbi:MAG TPA: M48 family metalloprotease [Burkholderiaceae bacterium]|nr:M48 family metalloprotease [Burkholderiaceae bacterium]
MKKPVPADPQPAPARQARAPLRRRALVGALCAALAGAPATRADVPSDSLPTLGEAGGEELSPLEERKLGEEAMREIRQEPTYLDDPDATEYLNNLGYQLVAASPARQIDFQFFLMRDPMINAFALPGGFVAAHTGLILLAQNESELASVLGHEIGHVQQRHIARMLAKQKETTAIALGSLLLALLAARGGSGQATEAALMVGQAAAIQRQLNFSRDAEREADRVGFQTLVNAGFDARAMVAFFTRMQQGTRIYASAAPAYLQTHPLTVERIADIEDRVRHTRVHQHADSLDFHLVRARLRVLQDDSQQGARDAMAYFDEQLRNHTAASEVAAQYGRAVAALRLKQPQLARDAAQAARALTREPSALLDKVVFESQYAAARNADERAAALRAAAEATVHYPVSRLVAIAYTDLLQQSGQHDKAIAYLHDELGLTHSDSLYFELLARSYEALNKHTLQHQAIAEAYLLLGSRRAAVEQLQLARRAGDGDFYVMSEVDARLHELQQQIKDARKSGDPDAMR